MTRQYAVTAALAVMITWGGVCKGASITLVPDRSWTGQGTEWVVAAVSGNYNESRQVTGGTNPQMWGVTLLFGTRLGSANCGSYISYQFSKTCGKGQLTPASGSSLCMNGSFDSAYAALVGRSILTLTSESDGVLFVNFYCSYNSGLGYGREFMNPINVIIQAAPTTCNGSVAPMTIRGMVGERLKATTELKVQCDSPATVRLTMPSQGAVAIGGGGEVLLTFQKNGKDVLDISGKDQIVSIDGELTKSPTNAGTYTGSTVVRLDVL